MNDNSLGAAEKLMNDNSLSVRSFSDMAVALRIARDNVQLSTIEMEALRARLDEIVMTYRHLLVLPPSVSIERREPQPLMVVMLHE